MSPRPATRRRWRVLIGLGALVGVLALLAFAAARVWVPRWLPVFAGGRPTSAPVERVVPAGTRVKVELFNATDSRGLARTAVAVLRDAGFDVVFFGNTVERHDSTVVRDRSNHPEWAALAARTMAPARTEVRADSGRLVDLTILVGTRWRPPTEPLRP